MDNNIRISTDFSMKRVHKKKKHFDYESGDTELSAEKRFDVEVHNRVFDIILNSFAVRFKDHQEISKKFKFLDPRHFVE